MPGLRKPGPLARASPRERSWFPQPGARSPRAPATYAGVRISILSIGVLMVLALGVRLLWLGADPAVDLSWSGAPFTDEGLYSHVARGQALNGALPVDGWDNRLVSPVWDRLAYAVFSVFGVGFVQLRAINVVLTTAALPMLWSLLRRDIGVGAAWVAVLLWAADYSWFQYSRLGLLEPGMLVLLIGSAWCWRNALESGNPGWSPAAGALAGAAIVWKSLALVWAPAPLLALLLLDRRLPRRQVALGYGCGLGVVLLLYALVWYLPRREAIDAYNAFYSAGRTPQPGALLRVLAGNLVSREIAGMAPALVLAAVPGIVAALVAAFRRRLAPAPALCLALVFCSCSLLALPYSPSRYWVPLVPALCGLAGYGIWAVARGTPAFQRAVAALVLVALVWDGWWYGRWALRRDWTLPDASRRLEQLIPAGNLVLGVAACGISLENTLACAPPFAGLANDDRPAERLGAHYAVVEIGSADDYLRRFYGDVLARSRLIERLRVGPREYGVYELRIEN